MALPWETAVFSSAMDVEQFNTDMVRLLNGETVEIPTYNFKKGIREYNGNFLRRNGQEIV